MMVIIGAVVALILEITVKKAFVWLESKLADSDKAVKLAAAFKAFTIQAITWAMVVAFTDILVENMPLPGGAVFLPVWLALVYVIQYLFSCWGIKGLQDFGVKRIARAEARAEAKALAEANRPCLTPTSVKGVYRNPEGVLVDSRNNPI